VQGVCSRKRKARWYADPKEEKRENFPEKHFYLLYKDKIDIENRI